jgi:hypothetical protein
VNNDPVNWVDPWGLADIVVIRALENNSTANNRNYNTLVEIEFAEIRKAAEEKNMTIEVIGGQDATADSIIAELGRNDTSRLTILYHGGSDGSIYGVDNVKVDVGSLNTSNIGSNLKTVDLVGCYANIGVEQFTRTTGISDVRTYNPENKEIIYNQTNDVVNNRIPESIRTGVDTSGPSSVVPATDFWNVGSRAENLTINKGEQYGNNKKNK